MNSIYLQKENQFKKNMKRIILYILPIMLFSVMVISCKKKETPTTPTEEYTLSFEKKTYYLLKGNSMTLKPELTPANSEAVYDWSTKYEDIISLKDGKVTGIEIGSARVMCSALINGTEVASAKVNIEVSLERLLFDLEEENSLTCGDAINSRIYLLSGEGIDMSKVEWSTTDKDVAQGKDGMIYAGTKAGTATITAKYGEYTAETVIKTSKFTISSPKASMVKGETMQLTTNAQSGADITWSTSLLMVAPVDANGLVTCKGTGNAVITATRDNGLFNVTATTEIKAEEFIFKVASKVMAKNQTIKVETNAPLDEILVEVSSPNILSYENGYITALEYGDCLIQAKYKVNLAKIIISVAPYSFSVGDGKKIVFAPANLQYKASNNTWRFATSAINVVGETNLRRSSTLAEYIDMFAFGTSGWNNGSGMYLPYEYPASANACLSYSLTGTYANADWGIYNAIDSYAAGTWRLPTKDEASTIIKNCKNNNRIFYASIGTNLKGCFLLPDNWPGIEGFTYKTDDNYVNSISTVEFNKLIETGAAYFPITGYITYDTDAKKGTLASTDQIGMYYTSDTGSLENRSYRIWFSLKAQNETTVTQQFNTTLSSVRLVKEVK